MKRWLAPFKGERVKKLKGEKMAGALLTACLVNLEQLENLESLENLENLVNLENLEIPNRLELLKILVP